MSHQKNKKKQSYIFNPYELAFCGFPHSGKTTLITRLIKEFSVRYKVGYIKHDVHGFDMDREGKDTFRASQSGARMVSIGDREHCAVIQNGKRDMPAHQNLFLENDFVFVEGYKNSPIPKIIFVDEHEKILDDIKEDRFENIVAFSGLEERYDHLPSDKPYFHRDDIDGLKLFIENFLKQKTEEIPLYGLVLAGGKSTRMKKDKSLLEYHGKSQTEHCFELLSQTCEKVFVSNREEQSQLSKHQNFPQIHDTFLNIGPLGGILSAMTAYPNAAWLVLACDLPYVTTEALETLIQKRNPFKMVTAYQSTNDALPEPLCAIYEPKSISRLLQFLANGCNCPRKILINSDIEMTTQEGEGAMDNVNNPEEYQQAVKRISSS